MQVITYKDIISIVEEFSRYISEMKSKNQYVDIVKEYLLNEVCNQVYSNDYKEIFAKNRIIDFQQNYRRSLVIRSALNKLKDFLIKQGKLSTYFNFRFEYIGSKEAKNNKSVISLDDIQNIVLGKEGQFRNKTEKIITQCMSAICYTCIFEQRHIRMLKCNDILIDEQRIRNVRLDDRPDEKLVKWIYIENEIIDYIKTYAAFFNIDMYSDDLFFRAPEQMEFDNSYQNKLFANYSFKSNGFLSVNAQQLNYSRIYHYLVATKGNGVADILLITGFSNEQLKNAMREYMSDYGIEYNPNSIVALLDIAEVSDKYQQTIEFYENSITIEEEEIVNAKNEFDDICISYLEENDINMNDVLSFDSMSENNQKNKDIELSRLVRSTYLSEKLKHIYNNCCQLCGTTLMKNRNEAYSEAHHIKPYNKTHKGDDTIGNMVVLCPNCHTQFDNLYYAIHPETKLVHCQNEKDKFHLANMTFLGIHTLEEKYLIYTWELFKKK